MANDPIITPGGTPAASGGLSIGSVVAGAPAGSVLYIDNAGTLQSKLWLPDQVANLSAWFKADAIAGANDGDLIQTWEDQSSNGFDLAQATSGKRPVYKANSKNNLPALQFDGISQFLFSTLVLRGTPCSVIIAFKANSLHDNTYLLDGPATNNGAYIYNVGQGFCQFAAGSFANVFPDPTMDLNWHIVSGVWGTGGNSQMWMDQVHPCPNGPQNIGSLTTYSGLSLGASSSAGLYCFAANVAEVLVYTAAISTSNRNSVEEYLSLKYGIPLV